LGLRENKVRIFIFSTPFAFACLSILRYSQPDAGNARGRSGAIDRLVQIGVCKDLSSGCGCPELHLHLKAAQPHFFHVGAGFSPHVTAEAGTHMCFGEG